MTDIEDDDEKPWVRRNFGEAVEAVAVLSNLIDDSGDFGHDWRRLGNILEGCALKYRVNLEGTEQGWGHPVLVMEIVLNRRPSRHLLDALAPVWFDIESTEMLDVRIGYGIGKGDVAPLFDTRDGTGINRALDVFNDGANPNPE